MQRVFNDQNGFIQRERLLDEIECSQLGCPHGSFDRPVPRDHDHHGIRRDLAHFGKNLQAIHSGQPNIEQHNRDFPFQKQFQRLLAAGYRFSGEISVLENPLDGSLDSFFIIDDQNNRARHREPIVLRKQAHWPELLEPASALRQLAVDRNLNWGRRVQDFQVCASGKSMIIFVPSGTLGSARTIP
jgi:hypothetical protein